MYIKNIFYFLNKKNYLNKNYYFKSSKRNILINKNMLNIKMAIYNGKYYIPFKITENKINNLIGSFSFSRNILLKKQKKNYNRKK
jgi:ribosomal protein S19